MAMASEQNVRVFSAVLVVEVVIGTELVSSVKA
jgi:hypothetical protein